MSIIYTRFTTIRAGECRDFSQLTGVDGIDHNGGSLSIESNAVFNAPNLEYISGSLIVYENVRLDVPKLSVVGSLRIFSAVARFPVLTRVCGDVNVQPYAAVDAPALVEVGGNLRVGGGHRRRLSGGRLDAPRLAHAGGLDVEYGGVLIGPRGVQAEPGDTWMMFRRRFISAFATNPNERCSNRRTCVEHAHDNTIESCKRRNRVIR